MPAEPKPTNTVKPSKTKLIRVASIKEPPLPQETPAGTKFALTVVTLNFKQEDLACTKEVYATVKSTRPNYKVHSDWLLTVDPSSGLIVRVTETPKPNTMPGFTRTDEGKEPSKFVVISLFPDGSSAVTGIPERTPDAIASEIQDSVTEVEDEIHTGMKVGRFIVMEKREVPGSTEIHVDPMPR